MFVSIYNKFIRVWIIQVDTEHTVLQNPKQKMTKKCSAQTILESLCTPMFLLYSILVYFVNVNVIEDDSKL